jgi:uncharacterized protein
MDPITHFEIPYDEYEKAKDFYTKVFGWTFQDIPDMNYHMANTCEVDEKFMAKEPNRINGGMYKRHEGPSSKSPVLVINVQDIDISINKVKESGGKMLMDRVKVGDMGLYAQFKDPEGNILALWENLKK